MYSKVVSIVICLIYPEVYWFQPGYFFNSRPPPGVYLLIELPFIYKV